MTDNSTGQAVPDEGAASPRLQDMIRGAIEEVDRICYSVDDLGDDERERVSADAVAAWREACTIRTLDQLDALPVGSVIRWDRGPGCAAQVIERSGGRDWFAPGDDCSEPHGPHMLPALLLWHPDWSDQ